MVVIVTRSSIGKDAIPIQNMYSTKIDNVNNNLVVSQGGTLGTRQDAVVRKMTPVMEEELELAA